MNNNVRRQSIIYHGTCFLLKINWDFKTYFGCDFYQCICQNNGFVLEEIAETDDFVLYESQRILGRLSLLESKTEFAQKILYNISSTTRI